MTSNIKISIDDSLKEENVLRRYLDMPRFISFLKSSTLYLCRSDLFQDKFEGSFTVSVKDAIINSYNKNKIEYTYEKFKKELREGVFINCWSLGADDNMALWKLYGKTNDCVAITTTVGKLSTALNNYTGQGCISLRKVEYIKHWKDPKIKIKPYSNVFKYKTVGYAFESEVRIILDRFSETFESPSKDEGITLPVNLSKFLRSIVVSPECSIWFKAVVQDVADKYGVICPIRNSSMSKKPI
jgi:hypothetical protein